MIRYAFYTLIMTGIVQYSPAWSDDSTSSPCAELIKVSDISDYLDEAFGPYDSFEKDKEPLKNAMKAQGLSNRSIDDNIAALETFSKVAQSAKKPVMIAIKNDLSTQLRNNFTEAEINELIRIYTSPVMKKFKNFSTQNMPRAVKKVLIEKEKNLAQPFADLQKKLVISQGTPTDKPD